MAEEKRALGYICPECGKAVLPKKSKRGKIFYGCSNYPECKFMSWDLPTGGKCPTCGAYLIKTPRGVIKCSSKECSYREQRKKTNEN